jgi:hypothetical protein
MAVVDEVSPAYYGEDRIVLSLAPGASPQALDAVLVDVDYSACLPEGVVLPLEMTVMQESGESGFQRQSFTLFAPNQLAFVPREGGRCLVRLAEKHHNRWFGALEIDVAGELVAKR